MNRYDYNGKQLTVREISEQTGIKECKIRYRIKHNQPVTGPVLKRYEYDGKIMTLKEWAVYLKISIATLRMRLRCNQPYEKVFSKDRIVTSRSKSGVYFDPVSGERGTRAEMAALFQVTPQTIHLWAKEGKLEKQISDSHVGDVVSGWEVKSVTDDGLLCECEVCSNTKTFNSIKAIRKCDNAEHKMIHARQRLMGKEIKTMKITEIVEVNSQRNTRVVAHCNECNNTFEIWEANMYKGCKCQK